MDKKYVIKRNGEKVSFDRVKVEIAVRKASGDCGDEGLPIRVSREVAAKFDQSKKSLSVEDIQDLVVAALVRESKEIAMDYAKFRHAKSLVRGNHPIDEKIDALLNLENKENENANKNATLVSTQRDLMAGEISKDKARREMIPRHLMKAHDDGIIHIHDMDYLSQKMANCCLVNLEDMLTNGTKINGKLIETPKSLRTAATIMTQVVAGVASSQYGGQTISLAHISPYIDISRKKIREQVIEEYTNNNNDLNSANIDRAVKMRLDREIKDSVQTMQYQLETLSTTNGQSPFVSVNMDLGEVDQGQPREDLAILIAEVLKQRIIGVKNETGLYAAPAFPKLLYVLDEFNTKGGEYYWLTELAAKCSSKRLVPDYISAKKMRESKEGNVYPMMGCRSLLSVYKNKEDEYKFYGRFNIGVTTLNLPDVALSVDGDLDIFYEVLERRLDLVKDMQLIRHNHLKGTISDVAPILWQDGAIARLKQGEVIDEYLMDGYSTSSIGVAGLYEAVKVLLGVSHTSKEGEKLAIEILERINATADKWNKEYNIGFSVYGTPLESTTYKFAQSLRKRFGIIEGITDKDYIMNSYHIDVKEPIDAFSKLTKEAVFQDLTPGGAISYVELPDMSKNLPAVLSIIDHMYHTSIYAEINVAADMCLECGHEGEMLFDDKSRWYCPLCKNNKRNRLQITRRICGYIGSNETNKGRTSEIQDRVKHLGDY